MPDALKSVMPQAVAPKANKTKPPEEPVVARTDLDKAMARAETVDRRQKMTQEAMADAAASAVYTGETLVANFLASLAEGYLGTERMRVAGVDPRPVLGLSTMGYGVYRILTRQPGGGHLLALGAGPMNSWASSLGVQAGQGAARRWGSSTAAPQVPTIQMTAPSVAGPQRGGQQRQVLLTPPIEQPQPRRRPRHPEPLPARAEEPRQPRKDSRFPRASK